MADSFYIFKQFRRKEIANELIEKLRQLNIEFEIEDSNKLHGSSHARDNIPGRSVIKLKPEDFIVAQTELENYYKYQTERVDPGYYLFDFTDEELQNIIEQPGEWEDFDFQLAQKILKSKGKEINRRPLEENGKWLYPASHHMRWIYFGYLSAIAGGLFGIITGWHLYYKKKKLPDGRSVYRYSEWERMHGKLILLLGNIFLPIWLILKIRFQSEN